MIDNADPTPNSNKRTAGKTHRMMVGARSSHDGRDFYETPSEAVEKLLTVWKPPAGTKMWEPSCGAGAISKILVKHGYDVVSTDIEDRGYGEPHVDFLEQTETRAPIIITNPPFNISQEFVEKSLELAPQSIFLLRLQWISGQRRYKKFYSTGLLSTLFVHSSRIPRMHEPNYTGKKTTSTIDFAWFLFDREHVGSDPIVKFLP